jgi:hypothetical protein
MYTDGKDKRFLVLRFRKCTDDSDDKFCGTHVYKPSNTCEVTLSKKKDCEGRFFCKGRLVTAGHIPEGDCGFLHYTSVGKSYETEKELEHKASVKPAFFPIEDANKTFEIVYHYKIRSNILFTWVSKIFAVLNSKIHWYLIARSSFTL